MVLVQGLFLLAVRWPSAASPRLRGGGRLRGRGLRGARAGTPSSRAAFLATLHSEYYECLLGNKAIKNRKSKVRERRERERARERKRHQLLAIDAELQATRMYVVLTNHRFFAMSVSKILKKLEVAIDCHWYDLRVIGNTQGNRLFLQFDGKDKEIEIVSQVRTVHGPRCALFLSFAAGGRSSRQDDAHGHRDDLRRL